MKEKRVNEIKKMFEGIGLVKGAEYTNQEIVDLLLELQKIMFEGVYEKTHAAYMQEKDLMLHFSALAEQYGLKESNTYKRFERNMNDLGYTIGSFIKGMKGEKIARKNLKLISFDKNVKILYNIALEDEDAQAEYDAIVITPYGMFVVEVKNWGAEMNIDENGILTRNDQGIRYDLPGRMSIKESLLRENLGEFFPQFYQSFVLFSNENAKVNDKYQQIPICCGGGIVYCIRKCDEGKVLLDESQITRIAEIILSHHKEQKAPCKVNCEEIIEDYISLMVEIESAAEAEANEMVKNVRDKEKNEAEEKSEVEKDICPIPGFLTKEGAMKEKQHEGIVYGFLGGVALASIAITTANKLIARR